MAQPYVGEIRMFAGNFAPAGWYFCDGSLLAISENDTLFNLIGTTFGGDGQTTFAVPDLRGRAPVHNGTGIVIGELGGVETVTLGNAQMPSHSHTPLATGNTGTTAVAAGQVLAALPVASNAAYGSDAPTGALAPAAITSFGGGQPHENMQPFLVVNYIISLYGIFPSPN